MEIISKLNEIQAMLAKSSLTKFEYDEIVLKIVELKNKIPGSKKEITPVEVCKIIRDYFSLPKDFHITKNRKREFVTPRQIAYKILTDNTSMKLQKIADYFNQNHATILYGLKNINGLIDTDRETLKDYSEILSIAKRDISNLT